MAGDPLSIALWILAALWLLFSASRVVDLLGIPTLEAEARRYDGPQRTPRVSVVLAARDEKERIERSVRCLLEQRNVDIEVVAVDDRSTDGTCEILQRVAATDARLQVLRVDELPEGWLGKPWALHRGAQEIRGDWVLFTDADAWMGPDVVRRAVDAAEARGVEHLSLLPGESDVTLWGRASLLSFSMGLIFFAAQANRGLPVAVGVGAFNMVRTSAYRAIGGHAALRFDVIDDLKLGLLLLRGGFRSRCLGTRSGLEVRWAPTAGGIVRALEKNYFALFRYNTFLGAAAAAGMTVAHLGALLGPLTGRPAGVAAALALATVIVPARMLAARTGWHRVDRGHTIVAKITANPSTDSIPYLKATSLFANSNNCPYRIYTYGTSWH